MRERIWSELADVVFYTYYLPKYIRRKKSRRNCFEIFSLIFVISGLIGWYKYPESSLIFFVALIFIQLLNFFRNKFFIQEDELVKLELLNSFYGSQKLKLENLWLQNRSNLSEKAEKNFNTIREEELKILDRLNHCFVNDIKTINEESSLQRNQYLKRIK